MLLQVIAVRRVEVKWSRVFECHWTGGVTGWWYDGYAAAPQSGSC